MLLETEAEVGAGLSEPAAVTAGPSSTHPSVRKCKSEVGPTPPMVGSRKKPKHTAMGTTFARVKEQNLLGAVTVQG